MFVRTSLILRFREIDGLLRAADEFPEKVLQSAQDDFRYGIEGSLLRDIQYEPDKPAPDPEGKSNSLNWTSAAQKWKFRVTKGFGRGIPTARAEYGDRLVNKFSIRLNVRPKSVSFTVHSSDERTVYVFGPLSETNSYGDEYADENGDTLQQGFLIDRGWEPVAPKIARWRRVARQQFRDGFQELVNELRNRSND